MFNIKRIKSRACEFSCEEWEDDVSHIRREEGQAGQASRHTRQVVPGHSLINYLDTKAKCRHLKKLTPKRTLRQVFDAPSYMTPSPPHPYTLYTCTVHIHAGKGEGGVER
jgi:hypothetical protein